MLPEMAWMLLNPRAEVYHILLTGRDREKFVFVYIGGRRRVKRSSFENWYAGQTEATTGTEGLDPELLAKVLANPEMAALLTTLARNLK